MSLVVRVELAQRLTKNCLSSSNLIPQLQSCLFHHTVQPKFRAEVVRGIGGAMDRNKRNKVPLEWRPVSTQSSSSHSKSDPVVADGAKYEAGLQGERVDVGISSTFSTFQSAENSNKVALVGENVSSVVVTSSTIKHSNTIQACSSLIRFIEGKEGATQKEIEREAGVRIILPTSMKEDSIIIEGGSAESVSRASERILAIIDEVVKSPDLDYSHFISLPLAIHPELVDKLNKFQNSILGISQIHEVNSGLKSKTYEASELRIDRSIFINPKTFHLTVLMLKLWNKNLEKAAAEVLQTVSEKVIQALDARPVSIRLQGLECMKGSFSEARVLYAPIEEIGGEERLSRACQVIIDAFVEAGLVLERDAKHKLKFHATVMNVRHRKSGRYHWKRYNDSFDARPIFDQYGSENWGEYLIREAHLSERFASDENGYYHCCASIPFPEIL